MSVIELDAYFRRIGYDGLRAPKLQVLRDLCRLHPQAIPFENLDPLLGRPLGLDPASLQAKLVNSRRGGYCFEHNQLLQHVLIALGAPTQTLAARVLLNAPEGAVTPRTHILLRVTIDGASWIADVGFGRLTPTGPLLFEIGRGQATPHEPFRIVEAGSEFQIEVCVAGTWTELYRFDLSEHFAIDHEVTNFYIANSPKSYFRNAIVAARPVPDGRYALLNDRLTFYHLDGRRDVRTLATGAQLNDCLNEVFDIDVPDKEGLAHIFERFTDTPS